MCAALIVVADPRFESLPQMALRQGDEPVQTFAPNGLDHAFADRIRHWTARRCLQHTQAEPADRGVIVI